MKVAQKSICFGGSSKMFGLKFSHSRRRWFRFGRGECGETSVREESGGAAGLKKNMAWIGWQFTSNLEFAYQRHLYKTSMHICDVFYTKRNRSSGALYKNTNQNVIESRDKLETNIEDLLRTNMEFRSRIIKHKAEINCAG